MSTQMPYRFPNPAFLPLDVMIRRYREEGELPRCEWCNRDIRRTEGATLTIFGGRAYRHRLDPDRVYALSHDDCGCPDYDTGYNIQLPMLLYNGVDDDDPRSWTRHLALKNWVDGDILNAVTLGYELACLLDGSRQSEG